MHIKKIIAGMFFVIALMVPSQVFADSNWTGSYGSVTSGLHTQQTYDLGATGNGQGKNGSSNTHTNTPSGSSSSSSSSTPIGDPVPPTTTSQDIADSALQIGINQAIQDMGNGGQSGTVDHTHIDPGLGSGTNPGDCADCGDENKLFVSSTWDNAGTSGTVLFNYTPLYWDWSFTNSDFPNANFSVTKGPRDSIHEHFSKSGYWHVSYNEFGKYTWGYYEYRTITVWTDYGTGKSKTTETISIPHVTSVESHYKGWQHLTDFRLSDWDINGGGPNGGGGCVGGCTIPGPITQQVQLDTTTSQEVAK